MNAYSSIATGRLAVRRRLRSKTYRKGLLQGFTAQASFFRPFVPLRADALDASIERAWKMVGDALDVAANKEAMEIGKVSGQNYTGRNTTGNDE